MLALKGNLMDKILNVHGWEFSIAVGLISNVDDCMVHMVVLPNKPKKGYYAGGRSVLIG